MRRTLPTLPGVTAIAFRELSYPGEQVVLTPLRFLITFQQSRETRLPKDSSAEYLFGS